MKSPQITDSAGNLSASQSGCRSSRPENQPFSNQWYPQRTKAPLSLGNSQLAIVDFPASPWCWHNVRSVCPARVAETPTWQITNWMTPGDHWKLTSKWRRIIPGSSKYAFVFCSFTKRQLFFSIFSDSPFVFRIACQENTKTKLP